MPLTYASKILTLTFTILWTIYATIGGGRHIFYLTTDQWYSLTKINWISQPFCVMAIASGKVSVAYLILRLQAPCKWRTGLLYFIAVSSVVFGVVDCIITFAQCSPTYALWTANVTGSCWSTNVLTDCALALSGNVFFQSLTLRRLLGEQHTTQSWISRWRSYPSHSFVVFS